MPLITIPNVSEGRDEVAVGRLAQSLSENGCRVLDVHSDDVHNRSVFTATGAVGSLVDGLSVLAERAADAIDLARHEGAHPRVGALDVCPIVPYGEPMENAIAAAHAVGAAISQRAGLAVYFYGRASDDPRRTLPELRRGGLGALIERARAGFVPDLGPHEIDPHRGVVCVGARDVLIAFNVLVTGGEETARSIARLIRERDGGLPGVRALGFGMPGGHGQVSTNLTDPDSGGIEVVFGEIVAAAGTMGETVTRTEVVGLAPERYLPGPDAEATRLLIEPGRSLESVLAD
jgi:glutamate formiminotransferase / 5-formyltetrahydrofolate cyclo-ligase